MLAVCMLYAGTAAAVAAASDVLNVSYVVGLFVLLHQKIHAKSKLLSVFCLFQVQNDLNRSFFVSIKFQSQCNEFTVETVRFQIKCVE